MLNPEKSPDSAQFSSLEPLADHALAGGLPNTVMSLGDLVSLAFRSFRVNYRFFFRTLLLPAFIATLSYELTVFMITSWVGIAARSHLAVAPFVLYMSGAFAGMVFWFFSCLELVLRCMAIVRLILGLENAYQEAYRQAWVRKGGIFIAYNLSIMPVFVFLAVAALLAVVVERVLPHEAWLRFFVGTFFYGFLGGGLTLAVAFAILWGNLFLIVVSLEKDHWLAAVKRTTRLVFSRLYRGGSFACLLECVLILIAFAGYFPFGLVLLMKEVLHISLVGPAELVMKVPEFCLDTLLCVVLDAVAFTGFAFYYRDLLLRLEGIDIQRRIEMAPKN